MSFLKNLFSVEKERVTAYDSVIEEGYATVLENGQTLYGVKQEPNGTVQKTTLTIFGLKTSFYGNWKR